MRKTLMLMLVTISMILSGCGEKSPMQKLQSDTRFDDMNNAFWSNQHDEKSPLWSQAIAYCKAHKEKPNCDSVMQVFVVTNGSTKLPAYGTSGNNLTTPDFK